MADLEHQDPTVGVDASSDLERERLARRAEEGRPAPASQATTDADVDAQGADVNSAANVEARIAGATTPDVAPTADTPPA